MKITQKLAIVIPVYYKLMKLFQRYRQFIRFSIGAIIYNLVAYLIYMGLILVKCNYLIASTASFVTGITLGYFMNKLIVFPKPQHPYHASFFYYSGYNIFLLGLNLSVLFLLVDGLKFNPLLAQILVILIAALVSYNVLRGLFHGRFRAT